ncbi:MAG: SGNH/GDSL hydrolase family protein, partial [Clostridia bacterium]|nr:SGNH/GDSL hydrolase family protein [Clostridia bacterium]
AIKATLTRLQEKYPGVKIIYVAPFWERHNQLAAELGREIDKLVDEFDELYVVRTGDMEISYSDGGHPDTAGAKKIGAFLSEAIRDIVGEDFSA